MSEGSAPTVQANVVAVSPGAPEAAHQAPGIAADRRVLLRGDALFDPKELIRHLQNPKDLPDPADLAAVLSSILDDRQKLAVYPDDLAIPPRVPSRLGVQPQIAAV